MLVVLEPTAQSTRSLYGRWDEVPLPWQGRAVDAHFALLPSDPLSPSGFWAEVAVDGIITYDKDLRLSRWLAGVPRAILAGRLVPRVVHGQRYRVEGSPIEEP